MSGVLEIPGNTTQAQLLDMVNDRIRDLNAILATLVPNPATDDVDLGKNRIINLADPKNDLDAVNLRTLKHSAGSAATQTTPTIKAVTSGLDSYCIVFSKDGTVHDGDQAPGYAVTLERKGMPVAIWVMSIQPPVTDFNGNAQIDIGDGNGPKSILATDIVLPATKLGPVIVRKLAYAPIMPEGSRVTILIDKGGLAGGFTMGVVVKRTK